MWETEVIKKKKDLALAGVVDWAQAYEPKGCWFDSQSGAHAWVTGQVPSWGHMRDNHKSMFLSLSFFFPSPLFKNKYIRKDLKIPPDSSSFFYQHSSTKRRAQRWGWTEALAI